MNQQREQDLVEKLATGIPGFEILSEGGLPTCRVTLVVGTAGSGKTVFASQYLAEGNGQWALGNGQWAMG
jgi:circadian clock protein KaiC